MSVGGAYRRVVGACLMVDWRLAGVAFSMQGDKQDVQTLMTCGRLSASVSWAVDVNNAIMVPPSSHEVNQVFR